MDLYASETGLPPSPVNDTTANANQYQYQAQQHHEPMILRDSRSIEDPVLLHDQRVLANILDRQQDLTPPKQSYFEVNKENRNGDLNARCSLSSSSFYRRFRRRSSLTCGKSSASGCWR